MQTEAERPDPDAVLEGVEKHRRGRLRLFLGMAPGVGKTYAMLTEAHQRRAGGANILIGWVDTHGRRDTEALLPGLEVLPRRRVRRGSTWVDALDLDEILRRQPAVVVVDEMPHSNPPGSRHPKRWQDIEEILDLGVDVWSALNVQHLESLNGVVARVTGVEVSETIPDRVFDEADEVRLIDLPPDDLLARLSAGKIYLPQVIERARANYFRRSNLIALRELALRYMASRMENQIRSERLRSTRRIVEDTAWGVLLVMETPSMAEVREAARLARALSSPWFVVWLEGPSTPASSRPEVAEVLRFAQSLGGGTDVLAGDFTEEVVRAAREHNLSLVALSSASVSAWQLSRRLRDLRSVAPELNVITLAASGETGATWRERLSLWWNDLRIGPTGWWQAALTVGIVCLLLGPFHGLMEPTNYAMLYLLAVLWCGVRYGSGPAAFAALLAVLAFDYTIVQPRLSLTVADAQYFITFVVMLVVGLVAGQLVARREQLAKAANTREHQTRFLYEASKELGRQLSVADALKVLSGMLKAQAGCECEFWLPDWPEDEEGQPTKDKARVEFERAEAVLKKVDPAVVRWCFDHMKPAGRGTHTLISNPYWYVPMLAGNEVTAVAVLRFSSDDVFSDGATTTLIEALLNLGAQTLLRLESAQEAKQALILMEGEHLRHSLLQSLSHDLRTPITMLRAAAEGLLVKIRRRDLTGVDADAERLLETSTRMERLVSNILEMSRLQSGAIKLAKTWIPADDLFGAALSEMGGRLDGFKVETAIEPDCPLLYGDEVLLVRVMANLLDNASKYCPKGARIVLFAKRRGGKVALGVADDGPGLPAGNPQRLFDPFRRGRRENAVAGVGLGLAICRTIARAHDAEIFATASPYGGAAFTLVLPDEPPPELDSEEAVLAAEAQKSDADAGAETKTKMTKEKNE